MKRIDLLAIAFFIAVHGAPGAQDAKTIPPIASDSSRSISQIAIPGYCLDSTALLDTIRVDRGDSIFVYGAELYYRARADGKDFFVPVAGLLSHSDSLVIYRNLRLVGKELEKGAVDTSSHKIIRQRCVAMTKNGTRCKRLAAPGLDKCWQHKNE
jgi:hypothetical protein